MQRLHEDDLVGHVLRQEEWEVVSFPAIAEAEETHEFETIYGRFSHQRRVGDILHPEREPRETLDGCESDRWVSTILRDNINSRRPRLVAAWSRRNGSSATQNEIFPILRSGHSVLGYGQQTTELADYSVCSTWGIKNKRIYLLHVLRERMAYPDLKRAVRRQRDVHRPDVILIEDKASGTQLIQELIEEGVHSVEKVKPDGDKVMRMHAQTASIENGFVYVPAEAPWLPEYIHELTTFPRGKYDDQVDSTSQALAWLKTPEPSMLVYYRKLYMETMDQEGGLVRLLAPPGRTHVITITGRQILIPNDRILELSREDALPLLSAGFTWVVSE